MLCSTCLAALQELKHAVAARDDHVRMLHHGTIAGLAQAASSGCLCCRTLWVQLSELDKTRLLASDGDDRLAARGLPACDDKSLDAMIWRNHVEMGCGTTCGVRATRDVVPPDYMTFEIHIVRKRQPLSLPVSTSTSSVLFVLKPCPQKGMIGAC